jgi:hypothetical protein
LSIGIVQPPTDRRSNERNGIKAIIPVNLVYTESRVIIPAQVYNFTDIGLGVVTDHPIEAGVKATLTTIKGRLDFEVVWSQFYDGQHLCGLKVIDESIDLNTLFSGLTFSTIQAS